MKSNESHNKLIDLLTDLKDAIENNQLEIYYQPIVNLKNNRIIAAEAFIRWNHPEWGVISKDEFISVAEETKLIGKIRKWMIKEVFKDHKRWVNKGLSAIEIGINFSDLEFSEKYFIKSIKKLIEFFEFNPELLIMEIPEEVLLKNGEKIKQGIEELRAIGVKIALDNFGTAELSLSYLHSLNIDMIKIDPKFIDNIPTDPTGTAITKEIIALAKELKVELIAEGIKGFKQLSYLRQIDCAIGQGFVYSNPIPLNEFEELLKSGLSKPVTSSRYKTNSYKNRRNFFRIDLNYPLAADMTILKIDNKEIDIGDTKILIENIGPGGLSFISDIEFSIEKDILLKFVTNLVGEEIIVYGSPVSTGKTKSLTEKKLYKYRIEFKIEESDRSSLIQILNKVQIKMNNNVFFSEGRFVEGSYKNFFN